MPHATETTFDPANLCRECNKDTSPGSGLWVNRFISADGALCAECMYPDKCFMCEAKPPMDAEIVCEDCYDGD